MGFSSFLTWQDLGGELEAVAVLWKHARGLRCGRRVVTGDKNSKHIVDELDRLASDQSSSMHALPLLVL